MKLLDSVGQRFGRLIVESRAKNRRTSAAWNCVCDCGGRLVVLGTDLRNGHTQSCGCLRRETCGAVHFKHGNSSGVNGVSSTYHSWACMIQRCTNPTRMYWKYYGGRGIRVCDRWLIFENFLADMGQRPKHLSLDRINPDGDYEPSNCRWATALQQRHNRSCTYQNH